MRGHPSRPGLVHRDQRATIKPSCRTSYLVHYTNSISLYPFVCLPVHPFVTYWHCICMVHFPHTLGSCLHAPRVLPSASIDTARLLTSSYTSHSLSSRQTFLNIRQYSCLYIQPTPTHITILSICLSIRLSVCPFAAVMLTQLYADFKTLVGLLPAYFRKFL